MPDEGPSADETLVHELFRDYVARLELGEVPSLADYESRLATAQQRQLWRDLVRTLDHVDRELPVPVDPGTLVAERYKVQGELGKGGMGRVLLAHDQKNDRPVALKMLRLTGSKHETAALLRRERKALVRLHHPHIVNFLDADQWRDCFYLVMEVVDGANMRDVLDELRQRRSSAGPSWRPDARILAEVIRRPLPSGRQDLTAGRSYHQVMAAVAAACASALECAHAAHVVHRDLKPGNVLLAGGGNPVLLDFGLAGLCDASRGPLSSVLFGTPNYLAPEQAKAGRMGTDSRSDLYQLGAMLYEMLTLRRPWADEPPDQIVAAIKHKQLPRARQVEPAVPFELDCICARAMAGHPEQRYQTATELRVDLERYLGKRTLPEAARAGAPLALRCRYFAHRHGITAALILLAAAILVWQWLR